MHTNKHRISHLFTLVIMGVLFFTITACGPKSSTSNIAVTENPIVSETKVELDIYSGLPNPTWTLAPALASDLDSRIASLNASSETSECPQNLGYRGFIVHSLDAQSNSIQTLHACRGVIKVTDTVGSRYYVDPQRQIELWLLASSALAQPPISEELAAQIAKEINAP